MPQRIRHSIYLAAVVAGQRRARAGLPYEHYENLYDIPDKVLAEVHKMAKRVATAIRSTYGCNGTSTRQHNEPAGGQDVWHFHVHVFPRYTDDNLYKNEPNKDFSTTVERRPYTERLKAYFAEA